MIIGIGESLFFYVILFLLYGFFHRDEFKLNEIHKQHLKWDFLKLYGILWGERELSIVKMIEYDREGLVFTIDKLSQPVTTGVLLFSCVRDSEERWNEGKFKDTKGNYRFDFRHWLSPTREKIMKY